MTILMPRSWLKKADRKTTERQRSRNFRPSVAQLESRLVPYALSGDAWPVPSLVTISFVPDGTNINGYASNLDSTFNAKYGSASAWQSVIARAAEA
jgi:hypothetical protein